MSSRKRFIQQVTAAMMYTILAPVIHGCNRIKEKIAGNIAGANSTLGHRLHQPDFPVPTSEIKTDVLIVGAGIAGLSAARKLERSGIRDYYILELADKPGGNSVAGENEISKYPRGAHYIPIANTTDKDLIQFLAESNVIIGFDENNIPRYNENYLCSEPEERLYIKGIWQQGLIPEAGISSEEIEQFKSFFEFVDELRTKKGNDGLRAFDIPLVKSSKDPAFTHYDQMNMKEWMHLQGWTGQSLNWYVDYCCRDDYGSTLSETSAWAGLHYFASRNGEASNAQRHDVLTWPEGNEFLVNQLLRNLNVERIRLNELVFQLSVTNDFIESLTYNGIDNSTTKIQSRHVIFAVPQNLIKRILPKDTILHQYNPQYSAWMVANISLSSIPLSIQSSTLCWDNVIYQSESLGYVNACHQKITVNQNQLVLTYYLPLAEIEGQSARTRMKSKSHEIWCDEVISELSRIHPDIQSCIEKIEVWLWGHGMVKPIPGFLENKDRLASSNSISNLHFAHSDLSGISIFEEAFYQGNRAAEIVIKDLNS